MLINVKMPTIVGILTFMSRINFMLSWVEHGLFFITLGLDFFCGSIFCNCLLYYTVLSVPCSLVVTCWERADLLAPLCVVFPCVFCFFPIWCLGSGVILDWIDSWSLPSSVLSVIFIIHRAYFKDKKTMWSWLAGFIRSQLIWFYTNSKEDRELQTNSVRLMMVIDDNDVLSVLIWVQTSCNGYQQMTKVAASKMS